MEHAARRFAQSVLLTHLLLLVVVVALVAVAAREVYRSARRQVIDQTARRQTLLTEQTAAAIRHFCIEISETLQLPNAANPGLAPAIWQQLRNRASQFVLFDRATLRPTLRLPISQPDQTASIVQNAADWLRAVQAPSISHAFQIGQERVNLIACAGNENPNTLLVAVVPQINIDRQFLQGIHDEPRVSAVLLDENMRVLAAADPGIVGLSMIEEGSSPIVREIAQRYLRLGKPGSEVIEQGFTLGTHPFDSGIVNIEPIDVLGRRWWLSIGSELADVDAVVQRSFDRALILGIVVVVLMSGILVSTATQMIRSRVRLERIRHEAITRELSQARKIQLAWLPRNEDDPPNIDLCAINRPASHISGDFYNWFDLCDGRVCAVIGDVTGHGMAAAFLMATTQLLVRMIMPRVLSPGQCMEEINRELCKQVFNGQFVTMQILVIDRAKGRVEMATAGHPPPLISSGDTYDAMEIEPELVLGVDKDAQYPSRSFDVPAGASLVLYTDGVVDAQAVDGERFREEGLRSCLQGRFKDAQAMADRIIQAVTDFAGGRELADDLTLVTIQLDPAGKTTHRPPPAANPA